MDAEGWKVSGGMDVYEEGGILLDYKVTSVWKVIKGDLSEWEQQLNLYACILRHHGHTVSRLQIIAILRDWSKGEAQRDAAYPQAQVVNINIPLWDEEKATRFMRERVILHQQARFTMPECTPQDRWARPDVWAVMKPGRKSAVKLHTSEANAQAHAESEGGGLYVVHRVGASVRCESYCRVSAFCSQYKQEKLSA